jgi:hypothetical protein
MTIPHAEEIQKANLEGRLIPFVGSGFSKPLGLPDWRGLIAQVAEKVGYESDLFFLHGSYPQLLEYLSRYHQFEWNAFVHNMTVIFDSEEAVQKRKKSLSHIALTQLNVKTIYTTNYDTHIESCLRDSGKCVREYASLADFVRADDKLTECEVIKFHGTLVDPSTLVLTESQYFDRMSLEEAVDQRLRSDLLSNSFLFMGYSFNDTNIRYIWYKINKLKSLQNKASEFTLRPSYFVTFGNEPIQSELLKKWDIVTINLDPIDPTNSLADFLNQIK